MTNRKFIAVGTAAETTVTVTRERASGDTTQGLVLEADHQLTIGDVSSARMVLWSDTAPVHVEIVTGDAGDLRMWNVWREEELIQAWEGPARIDVDDEGDDLGLECHDGFGSDQPGLCVRISFDRAWTQSSEDS